MASLGSLVIELAANTARLQSDLGRAVHLAEKSARQMSDIFSKVGSLAGLAIGGLSFKAIVDSTVQAEHSMNRLSTALRTTGFAAGITSSEIEGMAKSLRATTPFDDDEIRKGIASLLRFRDVQGDVFREAVKLAPDLAVALDTDVVSAFQRMGRALADPTTGMKGLRDAGAKLSEQQLELVRRMQLLGDVAGAQRLSIDLMKKAFGGAAEGENVGLFKSIKDVDKAYDDLLKTIGKTAGMEISSFYGFLSQSLKDIEQIISRGDWVEKVLAIAKFAGGFRGGARLSEREAPSTGTRLIGGAVTEEQMAAIGKLQRNIERARELAVKRAEFNAKQNIELGKVAADATLEQEKDLAQQRLQVLDEFNSQGLLSIRGYFDARRTISEIALAAELATIKSKMAQESAALRIARERGEEDKQIAAQVAIKKLIEERSRLQVKAGAELVMSTIKEESEMKKLADHLKEVNAQIEMLRGKSAAAATLRTELQNDELRRRLTANQDVEGLKRVKELERLTIAQAGFNDERQKQEAIVARLGIEEERIQNSERMGAIGALDALQRTGQARATALAQLRDIVRSMEEIARASENPALIIQAEQARASLEKLATETDLLAQKFDTIFKDSFADVFADFITGTKTASQAFNSFANNVVREISRMVAQNFAQSLFGGAIGGGGARGIGTWLANVFGGGGGVDLGEIIGGTLPAFQRGTDFVPRNMMAMVHRGEAIVPAGENAGARSVVINVNISTPDAGSFRASRGQIVAEIAAGLSSGRRNL